MQYTTDARKCLRELQPSTDDRDNPWPVAHGRNGPWQWGRHEAADGKFAGCLQNLTPPAHPSTCVVLRPVKDPAYALSPERVQERQLVLELMEPLRQQVGLPSFLSRFS